MVGEPGFELQLALYAILPCSHGAGGGIRTHKLHGLLTRSICQFCYTGRFFNDAHTGFEPVIPDRQSGVIA